MQSKQQKDKKTQQANEKWMKELHEKIKPRKQHPWRKMNKDIDQNFKK